MSYMPKKRVALIIPNTDIILEQDLHTHLSEEYSVHVCRMYLEDVSEEAEIRMVDEELPKALELLKGVTDFHCAIFGCTSASVAGGFHRMQAIEKQISDTLHCKSSTAFGAVLKALQKRQAKNIALFTPYTDAVTAFMNTSLSHFGYTICYQKGMGLLADTDILQVPSDTVYNFVVDAKEAIPNEADVCFASCTNFQATENLDRLSKALQMPCISSNGSIIEFILDL